MSTRPRDREDLEIANLVKEAKREIRRSNVAERRARDAGLRNIKGCPICGGESLARSDARSSFLADELAPGVHGRAQGALCLPCFEWARKVNPEGGGAGHWHRSLLVDRLEKFNPPRDLWSRRLVGLSWASFAHRARVAGDPDPGDVDVAFSHLEGLRAEGIDWSPQMPEPSMPRRLTGT